MTKKEFTEQYDKLADAFPYEFKNGFREKAISGYVQDLTASWWSSLVTRILVSGNAKLNIEDAALGERRRLSEGLKTQEQISAMNLLQSNDGLNELLKKHGAKSAVDLIGVDMEERKERWDQK